MLRANIAKIVILVLLAGLAVFFYNKKSFIGGAAKMTAGSSSSAVEPGVPAQPELSGPDEAASFSGKNEISGSAEASMGAAAAPDRESLELVDGLVKAMLGREPKEINSDNKWEVLLAQQEYGVYPLYSKVLKRTGPGLEIILFSYAFPSLAEAKERVLAGELKLFGSIEKNALLELFKKENFQAEPEKKQLSGFGPSDKALIMELQKGSISGLLYYDSQGEKSYLRIKLENADMAGFSDRGPMPKKITSPSAITAKLVEDAEKNGASQIMGLLWEETKKMLTSTSTVSVENLVIARNLIKAGAPEGENGAVFAVLQKTLVEAMFRSINAGFASSLVAGNGSAAPPAELELLKTNDIAWELQYNGESYAPVKTSLMELYEKYPGSYWGQYAFVTEMENGFAESKCGLDSLRVIKEGERFLALRADSPFLTRVLFLMGKANETAYSVGLSVDKYRYVCEKTDCAALSKDGEKYRLEAIKYYAETLSRPDGREYDEHLSRVLPKLKTGGNTYCVFYVGCSPT